MISLKTNVIANKLINEIREITRKCLNNKQKLPTIVIIHANNLIPSKTYINRKIECAGILDLPLIYHKLAESITFEEIQSLITSYNHNNDVTGIIVQLPIYNHLIKYTRKVLNLISFEKDVEAISQSKESFKKFGILPCTASAVIRTLNEYHLDICKENDEIVIIGKSIIVGKPLYDYFQSLDYKVKIFDKASKNTARAIKRADLIISATGVPKLLSVNKIKKEVIIIDVGFHVSETGKIIGDVDWLNMITKAKAISPVPGGIGKLTVLYLFYNSLKLICKC